MWIFFILEPASQACWLAWIVGPGLAPPPCFFCIVLIADNIAECITLMHIVECKVLQDHLVMTKGLNNIVTTWEIIADQWGPIQDTFQAACGHFPRKSIELVVVIRYKTKTGQLTFLRSDLRRIPPPSSKIIFLFVLSPVSWYTLKFAREKYIQNAKKKQQKTA